MKEIVLPSGAILKITLSSFAVSRELYKVFLDEIKSIKLEGGLEIDFNLFKDIACEVLSSTKIEKALWECMKKATYNDMKITEDIFEPEDARGDYLQVILEVGKANIMPFMKNLSPQYSHFMGILHNGQA